MFKLALTSKIDQLIKSVLLNLVVWGHIQKTILFFVTKKELIMSPISLSVFLWQAFWYHIHSI